MKFPYKAIITSQSNHFNQLVSVLNQKTPSTFCYIGNIDLLSTVCVGFGGSRDVTEKGLSITRDCIEQLVNKNTTIVSGYARGVDVTAHTQALKLQGRTVVVLPYGIEKFFIRREMRRYWDWNKVLVLSEFSPKDKWSVAHAMQRNSTVIGLSKAMICVQAGETGGSISAGRKALSLNHPLFIPDMKGVSGNRILIDHGATPIKKNRKTDRANLDKLLSTLLGVNME